MSLSYMYPPRVLGEETPKSAYVSRGHEYMIEHPQLMSRFIFQVLKSRMTRRALAFTFSTRGAGHHVLRHPQHKDGSTPSGVQPMSNPREIKLFTIYTGCQPVAVFI
jgi:hypothetical protein